MNSLPQYTPEQIARWRVQVTTIIENAIKDNNFAIQSHKADGDLTLYSVYDWFKACSGQIPFDLDHWREVVLNFIMNGTPISKMSVLLPYNSDVLGVCVMEFAPAYSLYLFNLMESSMDESKFDQAQYIKAEMFLPDYRIPDIESLMPDRGYLYIVHVDGTPEYKIGYTGNFQKRLSQYKTHMPPSVLWVVDYLHESYLPTDVEKSIHHLFDEYRISGEWFNLSKNQLLNAKSALAILQGAANFWTDPVAVMKQIYRFYDDVGLIADSGDDS